MARPLRSRAMAPSEEIGLVWFRRDLRLDDNPAWAAATAERNARRARCTSSTRRLLGVGRPVPPPPADRQPPGPRLRPVRGDRRPAARALRRPRPSWCPRRSRVLGAAALYWNADVSPFAVRRDDAVAERARRARSSTLVRLAGAPAGHACSPRRARCPRCSRAFYKAWAKTDVGPVARAAATPSSTTTRASRCRSSTTRRRSSRARGGPAGGSTRSSSASTATTSDRDRPRRRRHVAALGRPALRHALAPHGRRGGRRRRRRPRRRSCASSPGATGTPTCSPRSPTCATEALDAEYATDRVAQRAGARSRPGRAASPGTRSSTPACASSARPAGCTTGCAMIVGVVPGEGPAGRLADRRAALPAPARRRRRGPERRATGSGWPAPAPTPRRTTGCSTRSTQSRESRPRRRLHPAVGARAGRRSTTTAIHAPWEAPPLELAAAGVALGRRLPRADRRPRRGPRASSSTSSAATADPAGATSRVARRGVRPRASRRRSACWSRRPTSRTGDPTRRWMPDRRGDEGARRRCGDVRSAPAARGGELSGAVSWRRRRSASGRAASCTLRRLIDTGA